MSFGRSVSPTKNASKQSESWIDDNSVDMIGEYMTENQLKSGNC